MNIERKVKTNKLDSHDSIGKATGFFLFRNVINDYNTDKEKQEDERKDIKKYGKVSVILSTIAIILSLSCLISKFANIEFAGFSNILMVIIYIFSGIIISTILSLYGFVFGVLQIRLNRKSVGIIGLILSIFGIFFVVSLIVFLLI